MKTIGILTSGGDAPGMNAAIRAIVRTAHVKGVTVYGIQRGYQGLIDGRVAEMGPRDVSGIINKGGTILRTARCKAFLEAEGRREAAQTLAHHGIEGLAVIGGDGSYRGAHDLYTEYGVPCIGVPGTIDNDIGGTDYTIGYDTALNTALDAIDKIRDTADSHERLFFVEVMGRHSGYLAMMCGVAGGAEAVLVPEYPPDYDALAASLRKGAELGKRSAIVVVAEGAATAMEAARAVSERSEFTDSRVVVIGHLQRGGIPTASDRILASRLGNAAVDALLEGEADKMVGWEGKEVLLRPISTAWERKMKFHESMKDLAHTLAS